MATSTLGNGTLVLAGTTSGTTTVTATAVAGTTTLTLPAATDTLVGKATTDTLTNKTLTSPTITGGALNGTVGATTPSTGAFTTLSASGIITSTATAGQVVKAESGTTGILYSNFVNTGGTFFYGIDNSAGSAIFSGSAAYAGFIGTSGARPLVLATNGAGRAFIDSSGNVGLGTTSTNAYRLTVTSGSSANTVAFQSTDSTAYTPTAYNGDKARLFLQGGGATGATNGIEFTAGGSNENYFGVVQESGGSGAFVFQTYNGSAYGERVRIESSGNLLVGDTTTIGTGGKLQVKSSTDTSIFKCTSSTTYAAIVSNVENTAARLMAFQYGSGGSPTNVGTITTNGTGVTYGTSSDYRLKENIVPMVGALDKVAQLKPVTYKWKINGSDGQGFIAHELAEVVPDAVQGAKDAIDADGNPTYQGIDTSYLVATLTAAIQELKAEFDAYKASHP